MRDFQIRVRDQHRVKRGTIGAPMSFDAILRHRPPSTWSLTISADDPIASKLVPGAGVRLFGEPGQVMSGSIGSPNSGISEARGGEHGGDPDAGGPNEGPGGVLTVSGEDDTGVLARRLVYPDPTVALNSSTATTSLGHYNVSGAAETVLRDLVNVNAGPGALTDRQVSGLVLAADQMRGASVEDDFRFTDLMEALDGLAVSGGVGYRVAQSGTDLEFQVYLPRDLSGTARYSLGLGNLNSYTFEIKPPEVTDVIVGVGGEDTARDFFCFSRTDPVWPEIRAELFADRRDLPNDGSPKTQRLAEREANERLDEGAGTAKISFEPIDTERLRMFRDVNVGDTVRLELARGSVTQVIREVRVRLTQQEGWRVVPVVGADGATSSPQIYKAVGRLIRRVHALETRR